MQSRAGCCEMKPAAIRPFFSRSCPRYGERSVRVSTVILAWLLAVTLLGVTIGPAAAQDDLTFTAEVDRTSISTDDVLTLQLTLAGTFNSSGRPQFPDIDGFSVVGSSQSSQFSMANGKVSSQMVFIYRLQPVKTGSLTIPSIAIQVGNQTYKTQAGNHRGDVGVAAGGSIDRSGSPAKCGGAGRAVGPGFLRQGRRR